MIEQGWIVVGRKKDGYGCAIVTVEHPSTRRALDARVRAAIKTWAKAKPCYVRYGDIPVCGHSMNHANGTAEKGVSVFYGEKLPNGRVRALPKNAIEFSSMALLRDRPLYIVTGDEVGTGSDGEPLLANCRILRKSHRQ
jgi:hypothetical protein